MPNDKSTLIFKASESPRRIELPRPEMSRPLRTSGSKAFSSFMPGGGNAMPQQQLAGMDTVSSNALATLARVMEGGSNPLDNVRSALTARSLMDLSASITPGGEALRGNALPAQGRAGKTGGAAPASGQKRTAPQAQVQHKSGDLGSLSAQFESGADGVAAIGYDRHGGTSYGKYQIASRPGTMNTFMEFLRKEAPDIAGRLAEAGPANTGNRSGEMPKVWQQIAAENPARFEALQDRFIHESHYVPALETISKSAGLGKGKFSPALQEVLWSTAVQHGPAAAARIFARATEQATAEAQGLPPKQQEKEIIKNVYAIRSQQFGSSTERVQEAVQNRLQREMKLALAMTDKGRTA